MVDIVKANLAHYLGGSEMADAEVGDWTCPVCGAHGTHKVTCKMPSGRCGRCKLPLDDCGCAGNPMRK